MLFLFTFIVWMYKSLKSFNMTFLDYDQPPSSHSKRTVVIKTVETRDGEVQSLF